MPEIKVLFVCLGNICRSPLAEGIFSKMVEENKLNELFLVDSAGTSNYHIGESPDPRTVRNARENGVTLTSRARQFQKDDFHSFDYIIPMDENNLYNIRTLESEVMDTEYEIMKMRYFDELAHNQDVPDPYYGGEQGFQNVFDILHRSNQSFLDYLIKMHEIR